MREVLVLFLFFFFFASISAHVWFNHIQTDTQDVMTLHAHSSRGKEAICFSYFCDDIFFLFSFPIFVDSTSSFFASLFSSRQDVRRTTAYRGTILLE